MTRTPLGYRLVIAIIAMGMGAMLFLGCGGGSTAPALNSPVSLTTTINEPTDVTATDIAQATVQPANPADGAATLTTPTLSTSAGTSIIPAGTESLLQVDLGNTGMTTGSLPMFSRDGQMSGDKCAILPAGDNAIQLSPNTALDLEDMSSMQVRGARQCLRVSSMKVLFSVHAGKPSTWTLPNHFKLDMERVGRMYVLKDSYLELFWQGRRAVPPQDNQVTITADLYDGQTKVAGPLTKTVTVSQNTALFTGSSNVPFNRVDITIDLRDAK